jgi:hypothetical protein
MGIASEHQENTFKAHVPTLRSKIPLLRNLTHNAHMSKTKVANWITLAIDARVNSL